MSPRPFQQHVQSADPSSAFEPEHVAACIAAGDLYALSALYDAYSVRALAVGWSILGTRTGTEQALTDATRDLWRYCAHQRPAAVSGGWLLCRVSAHALDDRRLGHGVAGRLSGLTETQCQILALACAGRMSRDDIATEMQMTPTTVARTMTRALLQLRTSPPVPQDGSSRRGVPAPSARAPAPARDCRAGEHAR